MTNKEKVSFISINIFILLLVGYRDFNILMSDKFVDSINVSEVNCNELGRNERYELVLKSNKSLMYKSFVTFRNCLEIEKFIKSNIKVSYDIEYYNYRDNYTLTNIEYEDNKVFYFKRNFFDLVLGQLITILVCNLIIYFFVYFLRVKSAS